MIILKSLTSFHFISSQSQSLLICGFPSVSAACFIKSRDLEGSRDCFKYIHNQLRCMEGRSKYSDIYIYIDYDVYSLGINNVFVSNIPQQLNYRYTIKHGLKMELTVWCTLQSINRREKSRSFLGVQFTNGTAIQHVNDVFRTRTDDKRTLHKITILCQYNHTNIVTFKYTLWEVFIRRDLIVPSGEIYLSQSLDYLSRYFFHTLMVRSMEAMISPKSWRITRIFMAEVNTTWKHSLPVDLPIDL